MSWLLALHSSSDTLAVGLQDLQAAGPPRLACFPLGRQLSNELLPCVEQLLPANQWSQIQRLAVATGPGGFTGTRLTVVLARTLAQQLQIPLHGFSSFLLIAHRLAAPGGALHGEPRFWLTQDLPRRGTVAGCYGPDPTALGGLAEVELPRLFRSGEVLPPGPQAAALVEPETDAAQLLQLALAAAAQHQPGPWGPVLPLYPTSPVDGG
jgi:tRNA threonylcarbamoyl adenosine modification protein YeaZ